MESLSVVSVTLVASEVRVAFEVLEQISSWVDACTGVGKFESPAATSDKASTTAAFDRFERLGLALTCDGTRISRYSPYFEIPKTGSVLGA
jgi:hypothetical protein